MGLRRGLLATLLALVLLAGCGSSGPDRNKLLTKFSAQLGQSSLNSPDLSSCLMKQARGLSTPQLQKLANAGSTPDSTTKALAYNLIGSCINQGHGAGAIRASIDSALVSDTPSSVPRVMVSCMVARANALPNSELAQLVEKGAQGGQDAVTAASQQAGRNLAAQCLQDPGVLSLLRAAFLRPIKSGLTSFSPAFRACVLGKAQIISIAQLRQLFSQPATASARGNALGRRWAQDCIASGAKP